MSIALYAVFAVLPVAAEPISLAGDCGEPRKIVAAPQNPRFAHLSWPKITRANDGTLIVAYVAGRFHGTHGEGCPAVSISTDGGKTFTPPKILKAYAATDAYTSGGNVALGVGADGSVALLSMAFKGDEANTIDGWRSTDAGKTWKEADVAPLAGNKTGSVYGHVIAMPDKRLAVVGHYRRGSTTRTAGLWLSYSRDFGQSWGPPETITASGLVEPAFICTENRFVGLARPNRTPAWYTQLTSDDLGKSWMSTSKVLEASPSKGVQYPSPGLFVDPHDPKRLFALVSQRFSADAGNQLYGRIDLYEADVRALEWKKLGTVASFPRSLKERGDLTYGWMTPTTGRKWYLVFYCGMHRGPNDIYGLEFELSQR